MKSIKIWGICLIGIGLCVGSCKGYRLKKEYKEKHEKYRTMMYRSDFQKCFVDSSRKYGLLYDSVMGWDKSDNNFIDTIPVNENIICN